MNDVDAGGRTETSGGGLPLTDATLAGARGEGVIRVRRDLNGAVFEILGTWRLAPGAELPDALRRAQQQGTPVTYEGPLHDPGEPGRRSVTVQVGLDGVHDYTRLPEGGQPGAPLLVIHLALAKLPYPATFQATAAAADTVRGPDKRSRQDVPEFGSPDRAGTPPWVATLDGVPGGSWDVAEDGAFVWYSTPAESDLGFVELYARADAMRERGPVVLATRHDPQGSADGAKVGAADRSAASGSAGAPRAGAAALGAATTGAATTGAVKAGAVTAGAATPGAPTLSTRRVVVERVGRSHDANYVIARGTAA